MPVRGTTAWQHAITMKKVINRDEGGDGRVTSSGTHYVMCAYGACEKDAFDLYKVRVATHEKGYEERWMNYVFCSQSCKEQWLKEWRHTMSLAER
jgi:hypothetical protein